MSLLALALLVINTMLGFIGGLAVRDAQANIREAKVVALLCGSFALSIIVASSTVYIVK